jgi:hypothetical protein
VAALAALAVAAAAIWWWTRPRPEAVDPLDFVTHDAEVLGVVRLADLWAKLPPVRPWEDDPAEAVERDAGLRPEEIETMWVVWHRPYEAVGWVVIRTVSPYSRGKILSRFRWQREERIGRWSRHVGATVFNGGTAAVAFLDEVTLIIGSEKGVREALSMEPDSEAKAALVELEGRAARHHAVGAVTTPSPLIKGLGLGGLVIGRPELALDVTDRACLKAVLPAQNAASTANIESALKVAIRFRKNWLPRRLDGHGEDVETLDRLLSEAKVSSGKEGVTVEMEGETGRTLRLLAALPRLLQKRPGGGRK